MICSSLVIVALLSFGSKSLILTIENGHIALILLHGLMPWLLESSRTCLSHGPVFILWHTCLGNMNIFVVWILTRSRNVEFQTLAVEYLIIVESWRCLIKTYVLSRKCFIIVSSTFGGPLSSGVFEVILDFLVCLDHILHSLEKAVIKLRVIGRVSVFLFWVQYDNIRMGLL